MRLSYRAGEAKLWAANTHIPTTYPLTQTYLYVYVPHTHTNIPTNTYIPALTSPHPPPPCHPRYT